MAHDDLATYLNDHLGGSKTALDLLEHLATAAHDVDDRTFFKGLHVDIAADRMTLEEVIRRVGDESRSLRDLGGWMMEKAFLAKLAVDDPGGNALKEYQSLELLLLGIHGKRVLWQVLGTIAPDLPELRQMDFAQFEQRAAEQYARVDARRLQSARHVFVRGAEAV
jgi:hypothetical protein